MLRRALVSLSLCLLVWQGPVATASDARIVAEAASGLNEQKSAHFASAIAVTANPHASDAALEILRRGGSAVDAAIAAQLVLGLVEPQSSGIGGGAFMLHWAAAQRQLSSWDGRESAPAAVASTHFLDASGKPMAFYDAVVGGHAVGVPGVVAMLAAAHREYGNLPWAQLFKPAIRLATQGFQISPRLYTLLSKSPSLPVNPEIQAYFFKQTKGEWEPKPVGTLLRNFDYADTLQRLAAGGVDAFYRGELAQRIVDAVQNDLNRPGLLSMQDMASYHARRGAAVCAPYLKYQVCGAPPPSSGGTTVLAILGLLDASEAHRQKRWQHEFIEASRLAFADRNRYVADPEFAEVPTAGLVDKAYLKQRAVLIGKKRRPDIVAGTPPGADLAWRDGVSEALPSTSHLSIVDAQGNMVSMTTSIETAFGSRIMVGGFLLNNQLTDFSFAPKNEAGEWIANRIQAGKRPRSSMSPTVVLEKGAPIMAIGSPGGARIIDYVAGSLFKVLGLGWSLEKAVASGHIVAMGDFLELEEGHFSEKAQARLQKLGHVPKLAPETSGIHAVMRDKDQWLGVADPRREGEVSGF